MDKSTILRKLSSIKYDLKRLISEDVDTWEDVKISEMVENLLDDIDTAEGNIRYLCKPTREARLYKQNNGRFAVDDETEFSCGCPLEMYLYDEWEECNVWCSGRVESMHVEGEQTYYFLNRDGKDKILEDGDLVRVRV